MLKNPLLTRYWIKPADPHGPFGFGVTAYSPDDALQCIAHAGYTIDAAACTIQEVTDLEALGEPHVLAHSGPLIFRGVWYPRQILGAT